MSYQYVEDCSVETGDSRLLSATWTDAHTTVTLSDCGELTAWDAARGGKRVNVVKMDNENESENLTWDNASMQYSSQTQTLLVQRSRSSTSDSISETSLWDVKGTNLTRVAHAVNEQAPSHVQVQVAFHPSGKVYATSAGGVVSICDGTSAQFNSVLCSAEVTPTDTDTITALAFSPSGSYLAVGTSCCVVELYHIQEPYTSLRHLGSYTWTQRPRTPITALVFDRSGSSGSSHSSANNDNHLYVAQSDGQVIVYDAKSIGEFLHKSTLPKALFQPILSWRPFNATSTAANYLKPALLHASADGSIQRVLLTASKHSQQGTIQAWDFTSRVGSKPAKLASVDVDLNHSDDDDRGIIAVEWRPALNEGSATSRGAFVVATQTGLRWFRAAGEVGLQVDQDNDDEEPNVIVNGNDAQAHVVGGQV